MTSSAREGWRLPATRQTAAVSPRICDLAHHRRCISCESARLCCYGLDRYEHRIVRHVGGHCLRYGTRRESSEYVLPGYFVVTYLLGNR